jgi:hypothetical protein
MDHHTLHGQQHLLHQHYNSGGSSFASSDMNQRRMMKKRESLDCQSLDCQSLQTSIKRVKLSISPGELRLQRDLALLESHGWIQVGRNDAEDMMDETILSGRRTPAAAVSPTSSTWIHSETQSRLSLVDSLRLCLFLPHGTTTVQSSNATASQTVVDDGSIQSAGEHSHQCGAYQQQHQQHPGRRSHNFYQNFASRNSGDNKRMWIQFPRRYPHKPPVVSRIEGFSVERVVVNDAPPPPSVGIAGCSGGGGSLSSSIMIRSRSSGDVVSSLQQTTSQEYDHHRQQRWDIGGGEPSSCHMSDDTPLIAQTTSTSAEPSSSSSSSSSTYQVCAGGTTVVWNHWSPVVSLGEFLDFLLQLAESPNLADEGGTGVNVGGRNVPLSTSSSFPSLYQATIVGHSAELSSGLFIEEHKMEDLMASSTSSTPRTSNVEVDLLSSLNPNRFDVGYAKSESFSGSGSGSGGSTSGCSSDDAASRIQTNTHPFRDVTGNHDYEDDIDDDDDDENDFDYNDAMEL